MIWRKCQLINKKEWVELTNEVEKQAEVNLEKPSLFGIITEPKTQFKRIVDNPIILVPFIIVTILTVLGMLLMMTQIDFMGIDPYFNQMSEEEVMIATIFAQATFAITGLFIPAFSILISTVIYFIIAKIAKSTVSFKQMFSMNTFIYMITVLSIFVNALGFFGMSNPNPDVYLTSLNSIIGAEGALGALLSSIEIFTIWGLIVTAIGLQIVARFSKGLAWGIVIVFFVITLGFSVGTAVVLEMFEGM